MIAVEEQVPLVCEPQDALELVLAQGFPHNLGLRGGRRVRLRWEGHLQA